MRLLKVLALCLVFGLENVSGQSHTTLMDNGYKGVVVAISPMLNESNGGSLIKSIKTSLTEASKALFVATRGRLYFKDIRILIPKAWHNTSIDQTAQTERFEDSDFRVEQTNPVYRHQPYTVQPGGCGDPGRFIHLTPEYLMENETAKWWGPRGRVLVRQWAQYRWGVFDEIGYNNDNLFPLYYWEDEIVNGTLRWNLRPNTCTDKTPEGRWMDENSKEACRFEGQIPGKSCRFVPDPDQNITSSLMAYQYLKHVEAFCDGESAHRHNSFAPNRHNIFCRSQSIWEVLKKHSDFTDSLVTTNSSTTPNFTVVREVEASFALVLDYSGSMEAANRIGRLRKTVQKWILHEVATGSAVGIVRFSAQASILANLTTIKDEESRRQLANVINVNMEGSTCIGCGLRMAVSQVLNNTTNKVIILVSDGAENEQPNITDVMKEVVDSGARVVTIAYGTLADKKMEELAQKTEGKSYIVFDNDDGTMSDDAFAGALKYQPGDTHANTRIQIYEYDYQGNSTQGNGSFVVDATLGRHLRFLLNTNNPSHVISAPVLISPNGTQFNITSNDSSVNLWIIKVDHAEKGTWLWEVGLSGNTNDYMRVSVTAQSKDPGTLPIYTESWMNVGSRNVNASQTLVIIYARVTQGPRIVVGAKVRAYVTRPDSTDAPVKIDLLDNGQGADTQGGDGVYSRYFTLYTATGRYAVKTQVWDEGSSYINDGFIASRLAPANPLDGPEPCCGTFVPFNPINGTRTGAFTRIAVAGSFQVISIPSSGDNFPPARVLDFKVSTEDNKVLNMTWTATGDDLDAGTVTGYEIRMSTNRSDMSEASFERGGNDTLILSFLESKNITNLLLEAGQRVSFSMSLKKELEPNQLYYFALRAIDDVDRTSEVSNHATIFVQDQTTTTSTTTTTTITTTITTTVSDDTSTITATVSDDTSTTTTTVSNDTSTTTATVSNDTSTTNTTETDDTSTTTPTTTTIKAATCGTETPVGLAGWKIALIVCGCIVGFLLIAVVVFFTCKK